jgi:rubrerythrin
MVCAKTGLTIRQWLALSIYQSLDRELADFPEWREQDKGSEMYQLAILQKQAYARIAKYRREYMRAYRAASKEAYALEKAVKRKTTKHCCPLCGTRLELDGEHQRCPLCDKVIVLSEERAPALGSGRREGMRPGDHPTP